MTAQSTFIRDLSLPYSEVVLHSKQQQQQQINSSFYQQMINDRPPLKRRNTFAFWTIVTLLFILTIGNLLLTITIIGVLRMSKGMQSIELIPEEEIIKFFGTTDLDRIYKRDGNIEGFIDEPVEIIGDAGNVLVNLLHRSGHSHTKLLINKNGINFKGINSFEIEDPISGEIVFTTHRPHYNIPNGVNNLNAKIISTSRITSPIEKSLEIESNKTVLRGSEGLTLDSQEILIVSEDKIIINNTIGSTYLISNNDGIYLDMDRIPVINSEHGIRSASIQYKICVCMPQGKLFRIPIPRGHNFKITCTHFNPKHDPCV